ncbi:MAG: type I restriction enzyme HsdR N-terminal domain-containing protein [Candidatus Desulfofervidaceae bacterium]|nr:type I restriction enzyme HsdR N-terminal domain-containing protein [Candidatus Desulfofervidaceae bacterium]MDL1970196.1 type I restriction enzyme HsdR N-terminal domain-containing protein [Candidatus Desulfofervidaceae bacterium]
MAEETIIDFLTGKRLPDTDMERLRQRVARFLVEEKGYNRSDIEVKTTLETTVDNKKIVFSIDYIIRLEGKRLVLINCFPTALVTREKLTLACARLLDDYQIPFTVITDGFATEVFDTVSGKELANDLNAIPDKNSLIKMLPQIHFTSLPEERKIKEKRILAAFEMLKCPGSCKECSFSTS